MKRFQLPLVRLKHTTYRSIEKQKKQPHECPERGNEALCSGLYKITSWAPRGPLHSIGIKMERSTVLQPQQGIKHNAPSSRSWTFPPAPNVFGGKYTSFFKLMDINAIFRISYLAWELILTICNIFNMWSVLIL